jgi:hypothetical protein
MAKRKVKLGGKRARFRCIFVLPPNYNPRIPQGFYWEGSVDDPGFKEAKAFHNAHCKNLSPLGEPEERK